MEEIKSQLANSQQVKFKEKLSYALTNTGQTMIYGLITTYLMLYLTDYLHIAAGIAGTILGAMRIFDAVNDPLMGAILDKTKTRFGKCRPYMLFTPIPLAVVTLIIFAPFKMGEAGYIAYVTIFYLLFTLIYTANDIPYWAMSSVITRPRRKGKNSDYDKTHRWTGFGYNHRRFLGY